MIAWWAVPVEALRDNAPKKTWAKGRLSVISLQSRGLCFSLAIRI